MDSTSFDGIYLEGEQQNLLSWMVESERALPKEQHGPFILLSMMDGYFLLHAHLGERPGIRPGDLDTLAENGLLRLGYSGGGDKTYEITPLGRRYYGETKSRAGEAIENIQAEVHRYLEADSFRASFPKAYDRWREAADELWSAETEGQFTEIGHICRESLQLFATALTGKAAFANVSIDPANTVTRIRAVLTQTNLGTTHRAFLDALLAYWGTVSDLVQRQEHGAQKQGEPLQWEDTRTVVFQTAIVMFEIARVVGNANSGQSQAGRRG